MNKWYKGEQIDESAIISGRIRLARNLKKYSFPIKLGADMAHSMIKDVVESIKNDRNPIGEYFENIDLKDITPIEKSSMLEKHNISMELLNKQLPTRVLLKDDESTSIMINEEDHIRIQTIFPGENIDKALELSNHIDDLIEESIEYAFDKDFGYLTSCPTNLGTGMRASFMLHIPNLEATGQLKNILQTIGKFGMTVRGIYGEGSESMGSIYQISNQVTLGKSENEIISALKGVTAQIIEQETKLREIFIKDRSKKLEDKIYRSYGILSKARRITGKEAMSHLSDIRIGYLAGNMDLPKLSMGIYEIMMNIQPGNLQKYFATELTDGERDIVRADYLRQIFD